MKPSPAASGGSLGSLPLPGTVPHPLYPETDGQPMGESQIHLVALYRLLEMLNHHFRNEPDVLVAGDLFIYFVEGQPSVCRAPDVMVARGTVGKHPRLSFRVWEEKCLPCTVFEIVSGKSVAADQGPKREFYARQGIPEYFLCDPDSLFIEPVVQGFELRRGTYHAIRPLKNGHVPSRRLGLEFFIRDLLIRAVDTATGRLIPTDEERANQEALSRKRDRKLLRAERERAETERERAETERERAETERERAEAERKRADELQRQLDELRRRQG